MTIEKQYYLMCDSCDKVYESRADDAQNLELEAIDDGWSVSDGDGFDGHGECLNEHHCQECVNATQEGE